MQKGDGAIETLRNTLKKPNNVDGTDDVLLMKPGPLSVSIHDREGQLRIRQYDSKSYIVSFRSVKAFRVTGMDDYSPLDEGKRRRGVASLEIGVRVLSTLADAGKAMMLKDIAAAAGMPPAKVHRYLASFLRTGMVSQDERSGRYDLGPFAARLGVVALARHDVIKRATGQLALLRNDIRETCFLSCWSDSGPIVFRWEDSLRPVTVNVLVGSVMPLLRSATGRVFLAFVPWSQVTGLLVDELPAAGMTEKEAAALAATIRDSGLARVEGELQADIDALAAPLFDQVGHMVGSVTALGRSGKFDISEDGVVAQRLRAFAKTVSI